jgi:hypothetical protein
MTARNLQRAPNDYLVATYIELSRKEDDAMLRNDIARATGLVNRRKEVDDVLRARGIEARRIAVSLWPGRASRIRGGKMKKPDPAVLNPSQLIDAYVDVAIEEERALELQEWRKLRTLFKRRTLITHFLTDRNRGLVMLLPLLRHNNAQVRLNAAEDLLEVMPEQARATLQDLAAHGPSQQRGCAGMCLRELEADSMKPSS